MGNNNGSLMNTNNVNNSIQPSSKDFVATKDNLQKVISYQQYMIDELNKTAKLTQDTSIPIDSPDINTYLDSYNKSMAIVDDPSNINKVNFDTYIHLQNKKITELQNAINTFPTKAQLNAPVKSIKNISTSKLLNVEEYTSKAIKPNGAPDDKYPNYLIYGNNGCLQYTKEVKDINNLENSKPGTWAFTTCNANDAKQRFTKDRITDINSYNAKITDNKMIEKYRINNEASALYPFYVVNPETAADQCLMLNNDGLSIMPCNMTSEQRFKALYSTITY